ncbi:hypothetical protein KDX27_35065 [Burkholderia cenocepacia]|uniref:hypothetical protein n=1 Tax=Burkholderia cenocepacia TaxID=95486 RepID=UPI001B9AAACC|nr:hypothetical protein [Burkholderia cenocepacia]MBR8029211.1 hypothetical protein [Burkholderia cenocepacia]MBR8172951.1 hypothetical protein [Burkholderia cenocepacia]
MNRFVEWVAGTVASAVVACDVRSADPVITARKSAARGMFVSLVAAAVLLAGSLIYAPDSEASNASTLAPVTATLQYYVAEGFAAAAMVSCAAGIYFLVRYVLVVKWPERFVDTTEG